ncbi:hypothetical protein EMCRGX_G024245 [Ephydatia muelleri]
MDIQGEPLDIQGEHGNQLDIQGEPLDMQGEHGNQLDIQGEHGNQLDIQGEPLDMQGEHGNQLDIQGEHGNQLDIQGEHGNQCLNESFYLTITLCTGDSGFQRPCRLNNLSCTPALAVAVAPTARRHAYQIRLGQNEANSLNPE